MNILDVLIVLIVASQAARWLHYGFARRVFSLTGFWLGIFIGAWIAPLALRILNDPLAELLLAIVIVFATATITGTIGKIVGEKSARFLERFRLKKFDVVLGSVFNVIMTLVIIWLFASILSGTPFRELNRQIRGSAVLQTMNNIMPPAPSVLSRITTLINPHSFPQVFVGPEPRPIDPVNSPSSAEVAAAIDAAGASVVRIESAGCGGVVFGSGFVAAPNTIVTNAHVIAGIDRPTLVDQNGRHQAEVMLFDPSLDLAVLRTSDLAGEPLPISDASYPRGTTATVLGYPGGGPLEAVPAGILQSINARGRNIYGRRLVTRPVYALQTTVQSGNSGGPVVLSDGTVIGVVFARSEADPDLGYAIAGSAVREQLERALAADQPVSSGACVAS